MAKKKTNTSQAKITQQPVSYQGKVTLKLCKGKQVIKTINTENSGTMLLFTGLARFLSGQFQETNSSFQSTYIPRYLGVGYQDIQTSTDVLDYKLFNEYNLGTRLELTPQNIRVDANAKTVTLPLVATILYTDIGSRRISELGLFSSIVPREETMLARVNIPKQDTSGSPGIELQVGMNLLVEWNIVIQNIM